MTLTIADIAGAIGGRLLSGDGATAVSGISIDTRTMAPGELYVAIRG